MSAPERGTQEYMGYQERMPSRKGMPDWEGVEDAEVVLAATVAPHWALRFTPLAVLLSLGLLSFFFGGSTPWFFSLFKLFLFLSAAVIIVDFRRGRLKADLSLPIAAKLPALLMLGLVGLGFIQLVPLPLAFLDIISPSAAEVYRNADATSGSLSVESAATLSNLAWLTAALLLGLWLVVFPYQDVNTSISMGRSGKRRSRNQWFEQARRTDRLVDSLQAGIVILGALLSITALVHWALKSEALFGLFAVNVPNLSALRAHWPFISPNHLSTFLSVATVVAFSRMVRLIQLRRLRSPSQETDNLALRVLRSPTEFGRVVPYALAVLTLLLCNILTLSRAGNALTFFALLVVWAVAIRFPVRQPVRSVKSSRRGEKKRGGFVFPFAGANKWQNQRRIATHLFAFFVLAVVVSAFLGRTGRDMASARLEYGLAAGIDQGRLIMIDVTWQVFSAFPLFGSGLGTWHLPAARVAPRELAAYKLDFAHNDFLQLLAETGAVGGLLILAALFLLVSAGVRTWRMPLRPIDRVQFAGAACAAALPLIHSLVDFPFHLPATATLIVLAIAVYIRLIERARHEVSTSEPN